MPLRVGRDSCKKPQNKLKSLTLFPDGGVMASNFEGGSGFACKSQRLGVLSLLKSVTYDRFRMEAFLIRVQIAAPRTSHHAALDASRAAEVLCNSASSNCSILNAMMPRKLMCPKCTGPMRRSQASSIGYFSLRQRSTTPCIFMVFHATTMLVSNACEPEIARISSRRRPRSGRIRPW